MPSWARRGALGASALVAGMGAAIALANAGGLDPSFGTNGTVVLDRPTGTYPTPTAVMPGGKIIVMTSADDKIAVSRLLPDGAPDPSFDGDGQAVIQNAQPLRGYALAVQPDGRIIVAGSIANSAPGFDAAVWRLKADGGDSSPNSALDPTFDTDGMAVVDSGTEDHAFAVAIQPDGKIVIGGQSYTSPGPPIIGVWRLKANGGTGAVNGALDPTFDTDGAAGVSDAGGAFLTAMALQGDGKILLAGQGTPAGDAIVWRLKAGGGAGALNGALDPTFDADGHASINSGGDEVPTGIAVQPDGRIVVSGRTDNAPHGDAATVWRLTSAGAPDTTFDTDGGATVDSGGAARGEAVALQPDGKILLAGSTKLGAAPFVAALWRLRADGGGGGVNGALDPTFNTGGVATVASGTGAAAGALALQPDRRIVVAGANFSANLLVFRVLGDPFSLSVATAGGGRGSVQSSPAGIACLPTCAAPFDDGAAVTLTATPGSGSTFAGWSGGGCSGTGTCTVTMSADQAVTATFDAGRPVAGHFVLKARHLSMKAFRRGAKRAKATVSGLPRATRIAASLLAGRTTLARAKATAGASGRARLTFRFSKKARARLRSRKLKRVTLRVTATPPGDTASKASRRVRLRR